MQVIKRDGSIEEFNVDKIISAVGKAFKSCNKKMSQYLYDMLSVLFDTLGGDTIGIEEVQNKVEDILMNDKHFDVAKSYIIYREQHKKIRERTVHKLKFIENIHDANDEKYLKKIILSGIETTLKATNDKELENRIKNFSNF